MLLSSRSGEPCEIQGLTRNGIASEPQGTPAESEYLLCGADIRTLFSRMDGPPLRPEFWSKSRRSACRRTRRSSIPMRPTVRRLAPLCVALYALDQTPHRGSHEHDLRCTRTSRTEGQLNR